MSKGKVYLVGAGPGDVGLLTVKGLRCLQRADVVLYDFHLNAQVLNYINHKAEFIYAGKRGGQHSMSQEEINALLVRLAQEGKTVCRLKGGDPFVFGRGGEEAQTLARAGVEFEVVPGVSSAIAAPAYAGIPLTHRKYSSSFAVIPGYEDATKERSSLRWEHLAQGVDTLVVLMAVRNIQELCAKLIQHGRAPETPVAVIRWGTRAEQSTLVSTLGRVAQEVRDREIKPPAVVVVGEVVRLREELQWFEKKPLFGHRVLITRESAEGFEPLESLGAEVMEFPCLQIHPPQDWAPLDAALERLKDYHWLVFQSANGVHYFMRRLLQLGRDVRALAHLRLSTVGPKTAQALRGYGLVADLQARSFRAEGLLQAFLEHTGGRLQGLRFLVPRAQEAREFFIQRLRELGAQVEDPVAYRALRPEARGRRLKRFLREGRITVAVFASGATFRNFLQILGPEEAQGLLQGVAIAALGPVTARAIRQAGLEVAISPREATVEALVEAITSWCLDNPRAPSVV